MQRFTDLKVWQRAHAFAVRIHETTESFPTSSHDLRGQLRRSAFSAPFNIAEGSKRQSPADYARFINTAEASLSECEAQLLFARDVQLMAPPIVDELADEAQQISRMLNALRVRVLGASTRRRA